MTRTSDNARSIAYSLREAQNALSTARKALARTVELMKAEEDGSDQFVQALIGTVDTSLAVLGGKDSQWHGYANHRAKSEPTRKDPIVGMDDAAAEVWIAKLQQDTKDATPGPGYDGTKDLVVSWEEASDLSDEVTSDERKMSAGVALRLGQALSEMDQAIGGTKRRVEDLRRRFIDDNSVKTWVNILDLEARSLVRFGPNARRKVSRETIDALHTQLQVNTHLSPGAKDNLESALAGLAEAGGADLG